MNDHSRRYNYNSIVDLVFFVRNLESHVQDKNWKILANDEKDFSKSKKVIMDYVTRKFDSFVLDLKLMYKL